MIEQIQQRKQVRESIGRAFAEAVRQREKRAELVADYDDPISASIPRTVPSWVLYERDQMFDAVARERAKLGKSPLPLKDILRAENCARGHTDYQEKFVLYCTELVLDKD